MNAIIECTGTVAEANSWLDHYHLLSLLKDGGMSRVYLAYDTDMHQRVALKLTEKDRFHEKLFVEEVHFMGRLNHPHILSLLDARKNAQGNYIVMPYIAGGTLQERIDQDTLSLEDISEILEQLLDALQYMHSRGIIHRDIKPGNILLNGNTVYLADFGIATHQEEDVIYVDGPIMGTFTYMAPEMYEGEISRQSDLYALGIVLYQMLTGNVPFDEPGALANYWKQKVERPLAPSLLNPYLSPAVEQVTLHALEREPQARFPTAAAFATAYRKAIAPSLFTRLTTMIVNTLRSFFPIKYRV